MKRGIAAVTSLALSAVSVSAAQMSFWDSLLKPFGGFENAYARYSVFINLGLYLVIFLGLAQWTLGEKFKGKGGKAVVTGIGIILSLSLALWERNAQINLVTAMGPVAMLVFIGVMGLAVYEGLVHSDFFENRKSSALAISFFFFFTALTAVGVSQQIGEKVPFILGILTLLYLLCMIWGAITLIRLFGGKDSVLKSIWGRDDALPPDTGKPPSDFEKIDSMLDNIEPRLEAGGKDLNDEVPKIEADAKKEDDSVKKTIGGIVRAIADLEGLLAKLEADIKVHKKYHEKESAVHAGLIAGSISNAAAVLKREKIKEDEAKEKLHFDVEHITAKMAECRGLINEAKALAHEIETQADLKGILNSLSNLESRLNVIEKWATGGA